MMPLKTEHQQNRSRPQQKIAVVGFLLLFWKTVRTDKLGFLLQPQKIHPGVILRGFSLSKNLSLHGLKAPLCKGSCHGKAVTEGLLQ